MWKLKSWSGRQTTGDSASRIHYRLTLNLRRAGSAPSQGTEAVLAGVSKHMVMPTNLSVTLRSPLLGRKGIRFSQSMQMEIFYGTSTELHGSNHANNIRQFLSISPSYISPVQTTSSTSSFHLVSTRLHKMVFTKLWTSSAKVFQIINMIHISLKLVSFRTTNFEFFKLQNS